MSTNEKNSGKVDVTRQPRFASALEEFQQIPHSKFKMPASPTNRQTRLTIPGFDRLAVEEFDMPH
jgi:hypothetical protein